MKSFGLCATANEAPPDRSASTPNHLGNAVSPYLLPQSHYGTGSKTLFNTSGMLLSFRYPFLRINNLPPLMGVMRILRLDRGSVEAFRVEHVVEHMRRARNSGRSNASCKMSFPATAPRCCERPDLPVVLRTAALFFA